MPVTKRTPVTVPAGTTLEHSAFSGVFGEITYDEDKNTLVINDGITLGGAPLLREDCANNAGALELLNVKDALSALASVKAELYDIANNSVGIQGLLNIQTQLGLLAADQVTLTALATDSTGLTALADYYTELVALGGQYAPLMALAQDKPRLQQLSDNYANLVSLAGNYSVLSGLISNNSALSTLAGQQAALSALSARLHLGTFSTSGSSAGIDIIAQTNNYVYRTSATNTSNTMHMALYDNSGVVGAISTANHTTTFSTTSDYRTKMHRADVKSYWELMKNLPTINFEFIASPGIEQCGWYAHELAEYIPVAVSGEKDAVDDNGDMIVQQVDYSKVVPYIAAALSEAQQRIESLEARVAQLEGLVKRLAD